ncbi:hypothetical protein TNCV_2373211 [Trichonephila clavipes]|nr:hypothetical protein TNCV_2373211 [Trichonephila clavipes]
MVEPWRSLMHQDWIHLYGGTLAQFDAARLDSSVLWNLALQSFFISDSRDILTQHHVSLGLFRPCQRVSPWWPACPDRTVHCQHSGGWHRSQSDLPHGGSLQPPHDRQRQTGQPFINERLSLKSHLPGSVPLEYLDFCVRGKFCQLAQGNRGLIVVKGSDQRKIFEKLGLFTINLEILPHFRDLNDHSLPDHLHDEVHEDISECTMVKSYRFARYLQYFNKLQAECKRQTAHLIE